MKLYPLQTWFLNLTGNCTGNEIQGLYNYVSNQFNDVVYQLSVILRSRQLPMGIHYIQIVFAVIIQYKH